MEVYKKVIDEIIDLRLKEATEYKRFVDHHNELDSWGDEAVYICNTTERHGHPCIQLHSGIELIAGQYSQEIQSDGFMKYFVERGVMVMQVI